MLCDCEIKEKGLALLCISKWLAPQRDSRLKVSALLRAGHKVSEVANLVGVSRTTVCAIKKRIDNGEGVNRRAGSGRKTVVDRDSLGMLLKGLLRLRNAVRGTACGMPFEGQQFFDHYLHIG